MADTCTAGEAAQSPLSQYPCPGACGCWVVDGNVPCIDCWVRANPLTPRQARRPDLAHHPRRPTPRPCEECHMDLAMRGHDRYCATGQASQ